MVRRSTVIASASSLLVVAGIGTALLLAACSQPPETNYGNPAGLRRDNLPGDAGSSEVTPSNCPTPVTGAGSGDGGSEGGATCAVSWANDIFPNMKPDGPWKCTTQTTCHGGVQAPVIDGTSGSTAYLSLKDYKIPGRTTPYINAGSTDPTQSSMDCNLQGKCGNSMPLAPGRVLTHDEICLLETWLACGAPNN